MHQLFIVSYLCHQTSQSASAKAKAELKSVKIIVPISFFETQCSKITCKYSFFTLIHYICEKTACKAVIKKTHNCKI